jgi:hypothetical protein
VNDWNVIDVTMVCMELDVLIAFRVMVNEEHRVSRIGSPGAFSLAGNEPIGGLLSIPSIHVGSLHSARARADTHTIAGCHGCQKDKAALMRLSRLYPLATRLEKCL